MKFLIALSVIVAVSCATQVTADSFFDHPVIKTKQAVDQLLLTTSAKLQVALEAVQNKVDKFVDNTDAWIDAKSKELSGTLKTVSDKVDEKIVEMKTLSEKNGYDLAHCEEIARKSQNNLVKALEDSVSCVVNRVHVVSSKMPPLREKLNETVVLLNKLLNENDGCIKNSTSSTTEKVLCLTKNNLKTSYEVSTRVPRLLYESARFTASAVFSPLPAGYCIAKTSVLATVEQTKSMFSEVNHCIKNQIENFKRDKKVVTEAATEVATEKSTEVVTESVTVVPL